jgi:hypothetical protein
VTRVTAVPVVGTFQENSNVSEKREQLEEISQKLQSEEENLVEMKKAIEELVVLKREAVENEDYNIANELK